ncbi:ribosome hibernation-promoting factor, HPF/YfiA family, partial [Listeria welshimeri]|uniref:ribosome hibernation-promoting factor, HPF/YfiA family n=1 Tax=Listeria welshimeri TaxID=1643 RepID=UPI003204B2F0
MTGTGKSVNVSITFRNIEATPPLKQFATEKVSNCLQKFVHQDTEAHLVLTVERNRQVAEISFHADGADFSAREEQEDLYVAIDALIDRITQQLRKNK